MREIGIAVVFLMLLLASCCSSAPDTVPDATQITTPHVDESGQPYKNTLKWSTASELDNFGFHVYRAEEEDGPFTRLTEEPLLGAGTTDEVSSYEFVDDTIDPYRVYWYYVESISMDGVAERFTPVLPSNPKLTREDDQDRG